MEVGIILDNASAEATFFYNGIVEAAQSVTFDLFGNTTSEQHYLGDGFDGDIFFLSASRVEMFAPSTYHTPLNEGLSKCPNCFLHYNMREEGASTLNDVNQEQRGTGTAYDLTISGTWTAYEEGY